MNGTAGATKQAIATPEEMLRYAMSLPVSTTIVGVDSLDILEQNLKIARGFRPMDLDAMKSLRERCAAYSGDGRFEPYKLALRYDNPSGPPGPRLPARRDPEGSPADAVQGSRQPLTTAIPSSRRLEKFAGPITRIGRPP